MYRKSLSTCQFVYIVSVSTRAEFITKIIINIEAHAACHFSMPMYLFHPIAVLYTHSSLLIADDLLHQARLHTQPPNTKPCILTFHANSQFYCVSFVIKFKITNYILPISMALPTQNLTKHNKTQNNNTTTTTTIF